MRNESEGGERAFVRDLLRYEGVHRVCVPAVSTDHDSLMKDSSVSIDVGTRKMVNYA